MNLPDNSRTVLTVVVLSVLVFGGVVGPVLAQQTPIPGGPNANGTNTTNGSAVTPVTPQPQPQPPNTTANQSASNQTQTQAQAQGGNQSQGSNESGGQYQNNPSVNNPWAQPDAQPGGAQQNGSDAPGPAPPNSGGSGGPISSMVSDQFSGFIEGLNNGVRNFIDGFQRYLLGLPAPGDPDDPSTWTDPDNGWWPNIVSLHLTLVGICFALLLLRAMHICTYGDNRKQRDELRRTVKIALFMLASVFLLSFLLHLSNETALALAPDSTEFLATPGNAARFGLGALLGSVLLAGWSGIVFFGVMIIMVQWFAVHFLFAMMPIAALSYSFRFTPVRWFGMFGIYGFGGLIFLKIVQALILRFLFELPLDPTEVGATAALLSVVGMLVGLYIALIGAPKQFKKILPSTVTGIVEDANSAAREAPDIISNARENLGDVRATFEDSVRGRTSGTDNGPERPGGNGGGRSGGGTTAARGSDSVGPGPDPDPDPHSNPPVSTGRSTTKSDDRGPLLDVNDSPGAAPIKNKSRRHDSTSSARGRNAVKRASNRND